MPADAQPARRYIKDFGPSERFGGVFSIANAQLGRTRNGDPFLKCLLGDRTGTLPARKWSVSEEQFRRLPTDGFVYAEGATQPYQGELQLIVDTIEPTEPGPAELPDLLPSTDRDPDEMFAEVRALLESLAHPAMAALARAYLADEMLMSQFRLAPAAKIMHHAYLGGLLEHTLTLMQGADRLLPLYPRLNRDLVLMGLFLHDLGKTRELIYDRSFAYSDRGELVGHIVEGALMLQDKAKQAMAAEGVRLPPGLLSVLQHIVLSHHGRAEYGAARLPATPEAIFVAMLDELDAKTFIALNAARPPEAPAFDLGGNFTERQWALQNVRLYRPDPLA
ncbi:MAG: HD domain-containing protein [Planctomycetota bacterium]|nr:MAG: HD domain-containing protein [Planctomycetota bacterium]